MATLNILFLGDIVGEPGRRAVIELLPVIREREGIDFVIVNGENSANGRGITPKISIDLLRAGAAVITTGDHVWDQKEILTYIDTEPRLLRPLNYPPGAPGQGSVVLETAKGKVGVINVQGRTFTQPSLENPFLAMDAEVARMREETPIIFVDIHAETTSEKVAMGRFLDGRVSAVVGTHTHVQTADEQVFPGGTAFLCDAGFCGPSESCLGRDISAIIQRFTTSLPVPFPIARGEVRLHGAIVEIDPETGRARSIRRLVERYGPSIAPEPAPVAQQTHPRRDAGRRRERADRAGCVTPIRRMKLLPTQTDEAALLYLGREAVSLLENRDFQSLADRFGYALAFGRSPATAIEEELRSCIAEFYASSGRRTPILPSMIVKYFMQSAASLFALVECVFIAAEGCPILAE